MIQVDALGEERPISFYSRKLTAAERNYTVYEQELLALVESARKFRFYIEGSDTLVRTDHQAILSIKGKKELPARIARWVFDIQSLLPPMAKAVAFWSSYGCGSGGVHSVLEF